MNISEVELEFMAKEASLKYLQDGVSMNDTILDMVKTSKLNPHQLARVCERANISTYDTMWSNLKHGDFTFELADQEKIANEVNNSPVRIDETLLDVNSIKQLIGKPKGLDTHADSEKKAEFTKIANAISIMEAPKISRAQRDKLMAKLAYFKNQSEFLTAEAALKYRKGVEDFAAGVKKAHLEGNDVSLLKIAALRSGLFKDNDVHNIFADVENSLKAYRISFNKVAGKQIEEDAIGNTSNKVNPQSALIKHIKILTGLREEVDMGQTATNYITTKIRSLGSKGV